MFASSRPFRAWAAGFLALTVLVGAWMRIMIAWPATGLGVDFTNLRHAHSHVAFFGWVTLALFGAIVPVVAANGRGEPKLGWIAHAIGVASVAAFLSFLRAGYDVFSIVISAVQVLFWIVLVARVWRLLRGVGGPRGEYWRVSVAFLLLAGASTLGPGIVMARGVTDTWTRELVVKLFLALFLGGFVVIGSFGALYGNRSSSRLARPALVLAALGAPLTALLHVRALPPGEWVVAAGRWGVLLAGVASLLVTVDSWRLARERPLAIVAVVSTAVKGMLELLAAMGQGLELTRSQPVVVAYLHLVLLGLVLPALVGALAPASRPIRRTLAYAFGVALMIATVAISGWPWALGQTMSVGISLATWLRVAALGAVLSAVAAWTLLVEIVGPGAIAAGDARPSASRTTPSRGAHPPERARTG